MGEDRTAIWSSHELIPIADPMLEKRDENKYDNLYFMCHYYAHD